MKFALGSDLHLEFGDLLEVETDANILLLAGDIVVADDLVPVDDVRLVDMKGHLFNDFFVRVAKEYDHVYMVLGNHEHYHGHIRTSEDVLREVLPDNVTLLVDEFVDLEDGLRLIGTTLWTDCNNDDWATKFSLRDQMNDYHVIQEDRKDSKGRKTKGRLRPETTMALHYKSVEFIRENMTDKTVVMTHHAPSFQSVNPVYSNSTNVNGGYASNLDNFIFKMDPIVWVHGHMHDPVDYKIGDVRVLANPRGYIGHEPGADNFRFITFEV